MFKSSLLVSAILASAKFDKSGPVPCKIPLQFAASVNQFNHATDKFNKYDIRYDAINKRLVLNEEIDVFSPEKRYYEYLLFAEAGIEYKFDPQNMVCTKAPSRPWRNFSIPTNATLENEFTLGGPGEMFVAQQWSNRIPFRQNARLLISVTLLNCFPYKEVFISDSNITDSVTNIFYNIKEGIQSPTDFIPPIMCLKTNKVSREPFKYSMFGYNV